MFATPKARRAALFVLVLVAPSALSVSDPQPTADRAASPTVLFEENRGQFRDDVAFVAATADTTFAFTRDGVEHWRMGNDGAWSRAAVMQLEAVDIRRPIGREIASGLKHYLGGDREFWVRDVPSFSSIVYQDAWSGIDVLFYGTRDGMLEYDVIVDPDADVAHVGFRFDGVRPLITSKGSVLLPTGIEHAPPVAYQEIKGRREIVRAEYHLDDDGTLRFIVGQHNDQRPLVIDPIVYSNVLGGSNNEYPTGIAVDGSGAAYLAGYTDSSNYPLRNAARGYGGAFDAFVTKFASNGAVVYSTYLGGSAGDLALDIAVDGSGHAYITGRTDSSNFPTRNAFQPSGGRSDVFVAKLNPTGNDIVYSTYLGGTDWGPDSGQAIAIDPSGAAIISGSSWSAGFPTKNALRSTSQNGDAFVTKLAPTGSSLIFSTLFGGSGEDVAYDVAVDASDAIYIAGKTNSPDIPVLNAAGPTLRGASDGFIAKLTPQGSSIAYSTYLGGSDHEQVSGIAIDATGRAHATGTTCSNDYPLVAPFQATTTNQGGCGSMDAFVTTLSATGDQIEFSTYLGGSASEYAGRIAINPRGEAVVVGETGSTDYPLRSSDQADQPSSDAYVSVIDTSAAELVYSSYHGGGSGDFGAAVAADAQGAIYVAGYTQSDNYPTVPATPRTHPGRFNFDAFATKITLPTTSTPPLAPAAPTGAAPGAPSANAAPIVESTTPLLTWTPSTGSTSYFVSIRRVTDNILVLTGEPVGNVQSWRVPAGLLSPGTTYRWSVQAGNAGGISASTSPIYFRTPVAPPLVLAFGDSVAAGHGFGALADGYPRNDARAYPGQLAMMLQGNVRNFAISGACAMSAGDPGAAPGTPECTSSVWRELNTFETLSGSMPTGARTVVLTVGADDIEFAECMKNMLAGSDDLGPCEDEELWGNLVRLSQNLDTVVPRLRSLVGSNARIVLTQYYDPFPGGSDPVCQVFAPMAAIRGNPFDPSFNTTQLPAAQQRAAIAADHVLLRLNQVLAASAADHDLVLATLDFAGHDMCRSDRDPVDRAAADHPQTWVFPLKVSVKAVQTRQIGFTSSTSTAYFAYPRPEAGPDSIPSCERAWRPGTSSPDLQDTRIIIPFGTADGAFAQSIELKAHVNCSPHPTLAGHAAIAAAVKQALDSA